MKLTELKQIIKRTILEEKEMKDSGKMTPQEEKMVSDYEEEAANKYALDSENPLDEVVKKVDNIIENWSKSFVENKVTANSRINEVEESNAQASPEAVNQYLRLLKQEFGDDLGTIIEKYIYDPELSSKRYSLSKVWTDEEFRKWAKADLEVGAEELGTDIIDSDFVQGTFEDIFYLPGFDGFDGVMNEVKKK